MNKTWKIFIILSTFVALPGISFAGTVSCYCYCGISLPAPCGDEDCKRACGYKEPTSSSSSGGGAASGLQQPFYNLGYGIGQSIGKFLFGDPQEKARKQAEEAARAADEARRARIARERADEAARIQAAEEARKRQETYDRLSSELQLSEGFDGGPGSGLDLMLGDSGNGLHPQGTSFFGMGGGANNDSRALDVRERQGYSATAAAPANPGDTLPLIMGNPNTDANVVDLRDKRPPYIVDPGAVSGGTQAPGTQSPEGKKTNGSTVTPSNASSTEEVLFPGKTLFPKNPDKRLLNPLIELPKGESLPIRGETADQFFARLQRTNLSRKIAEEGYRNIMFGPASNGKPYPRGQNPAVDAIVDDKIEENIERETNEIHDACRKAAQDMNAAWDEMEEKGIIRPGEDLRIKGNNGKDVVYEQALMSARKRVYDQLENDIRTAKLKSDHNLTILKQFAEQTQKPLFLGGPSTEQVKDPEQMQILLNNFMTSYSGYAK